MWVCFVNVHLSSQSGLQGSARATGWGKCSQRCSDTSRWSLLRTHTTLRLRSPTVTHAQIIRTILNAHDLLRSYKHILGLLEPSVDYDPVKPWLVCFFGLRGLVYDWHKVRKRELYRRREVMMCVQYTMQWRDVTQKSSPTFHNVFKIQWSRAELLPWQMWLHSSQGPEGSHTNCSLCSSIGMLKE